MSINQETERKAGPFLSDGTQKAFPFSFKIFDASQVRVFVSTDSFNDTELDPSVYSVTIEPNQEAAPGGTVTLNSAQPRGVYLSILSAVPYTQTLNLTSRGGFYPSVINDAFDRVVSQIQQLKELADRHLTVPSTSTKTPQQVMGEILDIASTANIYAQQAKEFLDKAIILDANVTENSSSVALMKSSVDASERNVSNLAAQVNEYSDELMLVAENLDAIQTVDNNEEVIATLAADLSGYPIVEFDGGEIGEPNASMNGVGGVMKVCADNIEVIKQVAESLKNAATLMNLAETVDEIGSTDYTTINETGQTGA